MKKILFIAALFVANSTWAASIATPENGWWWNPAKSGTGYNIEVQNNTVFVATFVYDAEGNPVWYSGSGKIDANNKVMVKLLRSEGGQCLGCVYTPATTADTGHQLTLTFNTESTATVNLDGAISQIERFSFNYGSGIHRLIGIWLVALMATPGTDTLGTSDTIGFASVNGNNAIGFRISDTNAPVITKALEGGQDYLSVTTVSAGEKLVLFFSFKGLNHIRGVAAIVSSNASADEIYNALMSSNTELMYGARIMPPPRSKVQTASVTQSGGNKADIAAMLGQLETVAALIEAEELNF